MPSRFPLHTSPLTVASATFLCAAAPLASAQRIGLVADNTNDAVTVFDAETREALASFDISGNVIGDCLIAPHFELGFVTTFNRTIYVVDLSGEAPRLADGVNPIRTTNPGEDLALSADGRFLIVTDGNQLVPISVVDIESRTEVDTLHLGVPNSAVDVAPDGSILIASSAGNVHRLGIDENGHLFDTGQSMVFASPNNVVASPAGNLGIAIGRGNSAKVRAFRIDGMERFQTSDLSSFGLCAVFSPSGDRLYVRTTTSVDVFAFDSLTGIAAGTPIFTFPVMQASAYYGIDQMAIDPDGTILYIPEGESLNMYDPATGGLLGTVASTDLRSATGVDVARLGPPPMPNEPPTMTFGDPVILWQRSHELIDVSCVVESGDDPDGDPLAIDLTMLSNEREDSNRFAPDFKDEWYDGGRGMLVRAERDPWWWQWFGNRRDRLSDREPSRGRYYILIMTADDGRGGVTRGATIAAVVPRFRTIFSLWIVLYEARAALAQVQLWLDDPDHYGDALIDLHEHGLSEETGPKQ